MNLSIVIPSYNMAARLRQGLIALCAQQIPPRLSLEIIVVDDGSSDDTAEVVASFLEAKVSVRRVWRPRDERSCRSLARNLGLQEAVGDLVIFLDAGVVVGPDFAERTLREVDQHPGTVLVYPTLGVFAAFAGHGEETFAELSGNALASRIPALLADPTWADGRLPWFDLVEDDLSRLPAPWLFAWSCALAVPRRLATVAGGFDTSFVKWGAEDAEFAARLHGAGARFRAISDAVTLHLPHAVEDLTTRRRQHQASLRHLHEKVASRDSELYCVVEDAQAAIALAARLDALPLRALTPHTGEDAIASFTAEVGQAERVLCLWPRDPQLLEGRPPAVVLAHNSASARLTAAALPGSRVLCSVGARTSFRDGEFDVAIAGDLVRMVPEALQRALLVELARIAQRVVLVLSPPQSDAFSRACRDAGGWRWTAPEELTAMVESMSPTTVLRRTGANNHVVLTWEAAGVTVRPEVSPGAERLSDGR